MAADHRSAAANTSSPSIPPAPPLPPTKYTASARHAFARFVTQPFTTYGSRPTSAQANRSDGTRVYPLAPRLPGLNSLSSQDASHKTGLEITALDVNHERTHAILAGREILKTVRVSGTKCTEEVNLRAAMISYAAHVTAGQAASTRNREALEIHDVKWSHGQFHTHIATAATNGKIILYDLNRAGVELARLHEHHRQVHRLAVNPHQGALLLSGSQDGTARLWDLRSMRKDVMSCPSKDKFSGLSEGVRDVRWSPTDGMEFAFGTDNGTIQRWDFRFNKAPKLRISAHDKMCSTIDWHPDGKHLMSASVDKTVRIWDFSTERRRQKPIWVLRTPYPIHNARWRPPCWSWDNSESGAWQCTQLATSYDREHTDVHLWDFRRPHLPFREVTRFSSWTAPTDMLWHSRDILWSVGREGVFAQTDVHFAPKVVDRRNLQALAISSTGEISAFVQRRPHNRGSSLEYAEPAYLGDSRAKRSSPEKSSLGRSEEDDGIEENFLSTSFQNRHHGRTASNRSTRSFGSTPPAEGPLKVKLLNESLQAEENIMQPNQVALRGVLPGAVSIPVFTYLAQKYKTIPPPEFATIESSREIQRIFNQNAEYAQRASLHRVAQTWKILGHMTAITLRRQIELRVHKKPVQKRRIPDKPKALPVVGESPTQMPEIHVVNPAVRAIQDADGASKPSSIMESSSNVPTPVVRPRHTLAAPSGTSQVPLPDPSQDEDLSLPPAITGPHSGGERAGSLLPQAGPVSTRPEFDGPHWYKSSDNLEERRAMVGSYRAQPRAPLSLEPAASSYAMDIAAPPPLDRHNSDESFAMFSASSGSARDASVPSSFASGQSHPQSMASIPEKWQSSLESSVENLPPVPESVVNSRFTGMNVVNNPSTSYGQSFQASSIHGAARRPTSPEKGSLSPKQKDESGEPSSLDRRAEQEKALHDIEALKRNNQLLRQDSSESEANMSSRCSYSDISPWSENMEASGTIVPDGAGEDRRSSLAFYQPAVKNETPSAPSTSEKDSDDKNTKSTPEEWEEEEEDLEAGSAFSAIRMVDEAIKFHTVFLSDSQAPALFILLLAPFLPQHSSHILPGAQKLLNAYGEYFSTLGMSLQQIKTIVNTDLTGLAFCGINILQAEAILSTYHTQLHSLSLYNAAASLRRLAYPSYPSVYQQNLKDTTFGLLCQSCRSPIHNPRDKTVCETCKTPSAPCPICWQEQPAFEGPGAKKKAGKLRRRSIKAGAPSRGGSVSHSREVSSTHIAAAGADAETDTNTDAEEGETSPSPSTPTPAPAPLPVLWSCCALCGHGAHAACLHAWFADAGAEGACPTDGCVCDCVAGRRREEKLRAAEERKAERERGRAVKGDEWRVGESRAVGGVRDAMAAAAAVAGASGDAVVAGAGAGATSVSSGSEPRPVPMPLQRKEEPRRVRLLEPRG